MNNKKFGSQPIRNIYIVDLLEDWKTVDGFSQDDGDVVLTFDFALHQKFASQSESVWYVDRILDKETNNDHNQAIKMLLKEWYKDPDGRDIFVHNGIEFGDSLTSVVINEIYYFIRMRSCLEKIAASNFEKIIICSRERIINSFFSKKNADFRVVVNTDSFESGYYFPISRWLKNKLGAGSMTKRVALSFFNFRHKLVFHLDKFSRNDLKKNIFIHEYHPTKFLIEELQLDSTKNVILGSTSISRSLKSAIFRDRVIPYWGSRRSYSGESKRLVSQFLKLQTLKFPLNINQDVGPELSGVICDAIFEYLPSVLRDLDSISRYVESFPVDLVVSISDLGLRESLIRTVAKRFGARDFIIINGILFSPFSDEGKGFDFTNSYSESIKELYFGFQDNVNALGDPRMDEYILNPVDYEPPKDNDYVVGVGTSGFNSLDLNAYVAIEFEFLFNILSAICRSKYFEKNMKVKLLVRTNGYLNQYRNFAEFFFPELEIEFFQGEKIHEVLRGVHLYITSYSQTLFEASCMCIPSIYFVNHREEVQEPFGPDTPFQSASNVESLLCLIDKIFDGDLKDEIIPSKKRLEYFIGPLDGRNLERNLLFIENLLLN